MKKTAIILALAASATALTAAQLVEAIVIRVGDRIVTRTQYTKRLHDAYTEIEQTAAPSEVAQKKAELLKSLTNDMIAELLIKDRADRLGITVSSDELKDATGRLMAQYGLKTQAEFEDSLRKSGMTPADTEARLRETLLMNKAFGS